MNAIIAKLDPLFKGDPEVDQVLPAVAWLNAFGDYYIEIGMLVRTPVSRWIFVYLRLEGR